MNNLSAEEEHGHIAFSPFKEGSKRLLFSGYRLHWEKTETKGAVPTPRAAHSADMLPDGNDMVVFGGWDGEAAMNELYILDTRTMEWKIPDATGEFPAPRNNHASCMVGHKLYIHGGHNGTEWLCDFHCLDTASWTWSGPIETTGAIPSTRACHTMSFLQDQLYLFGGFDGTDCFSTLHVLDLETMNWTLVSPVAVSPAPRNAHTMAVVDDFHLILFGGHSGNNLLTDLCVFDARTHKWDTETRVYGEPPHGLRGHSCTVITDQLLLTFGGYDGTVRHNLVSFLKFDKKRKSFTWIPLDVEEETAPLGRQRHSAVLLGPQKKIFIFGGFDGNGWLNDAYILDVSWVVDHPTSMALAELQDHMGELYRSGAFSDVTLAHNDMRYRSHRCILAARSRYFAIMFGSQMKEAKAPVVYIAAPWSDEAFSRFLEFLYTGRIANCKYDVLCEIMAIADQYACDQLKELVTSYLENTVNDENVCFILRKADSCGAPELKSYCTNYIVQNATSVSKTRGFEDLTATPWLLIGITKLTMQNNGHFY